MPAPAIEALVANWRSRADIAERVALARALWDSDVHEARIAAAKLLIQARSPEGEPLVWAEFLRWVPGFDAQAIADAVCKVGARRLIADPARFDIVEGWLGDPNMWVRRAALVATLPWSKLNHPDAGERAARERILGWAARLSPERDGFIQKALAGWLRSLSIHDPARTRAYLAEHGAA